MDLNNLTDEQKQAARECKTSEELLAFAQKEGIKLSIDQLEEISGGAWTEKNPKTN